jgi:hypothetical protein
VTLLVISVPLINCGRSLFPCASHQAQHNSKKEVCPFSFLVISTTKKARKLRGPFLLNVLKQVLGVLDRSSALAFAAFALSAFIFAFGLIATTAAFGVFIATATAFGVFIATTTAFGVFVATTAAFGVFVATATAFSVFVATTAAFSFVATFVATTAAFALSEHIGNA